jgi:flagellin-specific chaperone FliS
MNDFEDWASATYRQSHIDVEASDLVLIELIYSGVIRQLEALDHIDLEKFPAVGMDLRHAPKPS